MPPSFPVPEGLTYFPFQEEGIYFALQHSGTLLADEMGLGKSVQAIGIVNALANPERILIVCPATMRLVWKRELEKWLLHPCTLGIVGIDASALNARIIICNYDRLNQVRSFLLGRKWDLAIYDECHFLKNPVARRSMIALSIKAERRLCLSGTPLQNRPMELFGILSWLDPKTWPPQSRWTFGHRYCGAKYNGFGWDFLGSTPANLPELSQRLRASVMLRRTKAQVLPELPSKFRSVVELEATTNIRASVEAELSAFERWMEAKAKSESDSIKREGQYRAGVRDLQRFAGIEHETLAEARHAVALAKVPLVAEFVREGLQSGGKIVLFCHHRDVVFAYLEALAEFYPVSITGATNPSDRQLAIDHFQTKPDCRIFVGNIVAAGTGITLAPASNHCIFAELSFVPAQMSQAEDRLHRIGALNNVLIQHLVLAGSVDALMAHILVRKQKILDAVLDEKSDHKNVACSFTPAMTTTL
jgi:SWI/SNF-related matrix-associated actin-dependent regulator 1 of chromatin subfamily A